jgi:hypothetical protein
MKFNIPIEVTGINRVVIENKRGEKTSWDRTTHPWTTYPSNLTRWKTTIVIRSDMLDNGTKIDFCRDIFVSDQKMMKKIDTEKLNKRKRFWVGIGKTGNATLNIVLKPIPRPESKHRAPERVEEISVPMCVSVSTGIITGIMEDGTLLVKSRNIDTLQHDVIREARDEAHRRMMLENNQN